MTATSNLNEYIVDVCGTLVRDDTTLGLLQHHFSRSTHPRFRLYLLSAMTARHSPIRLAFLVAEKLTGKHFLKHIAVRLLAGEKMEALSESAAEYAGYLLAERRVSSVWSLLEAPLRSGQVVLASASLEPIVAALAVALGARHVASTLEDNRGVLTGRYLADLTGAKEQALVDKYGAPLLDGEICAISDNVSDRPLLEKAASVYVVLHKESHRPRWQGLKATFIRIDE